MTDTANIPLWAWPIIFLAAIAATTLCFALMPEIERGDHDDLFINEEGFPRRKAVLMISDCDTERTLGHLSDTEATQGMWDQPLTEAEKRRIEEHRQAYAFMDQPLTDEERHRAGLCSIEDEPCPACIEQAADAADQQSDAQNEADTETLLGKGILIEETEEGRRAFIAEEKERRRQRRERREAKNDTANE